jgi:hypothetical protein
LTQTARDRFNWGDEIVCVLEQSGDQVVYVGRTGRRIDPELIANARLEAQIGNGLLHFGASAPE